MRLSLRARLIVVPAVLVATTVALLAAFEQDAQRRWLVAHEVEVTLRTAGEVAPALVPDPQGGWQGAADSLESRLALRVRVIATDGRVLADSRGRATDMENHAGRPEVAAALAGRQGSDVRRSETLHEPYLYAAVPFVRGEAAVLRLAVPMGMLSHLEDALARLSLASAALTLVACLLVLGYVSERFAARLRRLGDVARGIGRGDRRVRAEDGPDDLGRLGSALNAMRDELDARLAALQQERDAREAILAHMTDGVALLDAQDRVVHVNHRMAALLDAVIRPVPGTPLSEFTRVPELLDMVESARRERRALERELKPWTTRTGPARAAATPLGDGVVLLVLHDLSESEALQRLRQDLVANVSHELRTPITSLRGYAETLLEGGLDDAENRERFVRVIRDQAVQLQTLVEDLLSLAEMERPDVTLRREPLDLRALAAESLSLFRDAAQRSGLELVLVPGPAVELVGDRVRLAQVIANLVENAIKYTERGRVEVSVGTDEGRVWLEVADTGPGIPDEDQPRVFERFYRVDKARSRAQGGTGLGLAIVKHAVALHGGTIALTSRVGQGSRFRVELPHEPRS
ncbi:MAG: ATP-binding protein [bacterium]